LFPGLSAENGFTSARGLRCTVFYATFKFFEARNAVVRYCAVDFAILTTNENEIEIVPGTLLTLFRRTTAKNT